MQAVEKAVEGVGKARRVEQGSRFAQDAAHRQNTAGDHAVNAAGQHHRAHHPPFPRTQAESALPVALGDGLQALLGGPHDRGKIHDDQSKAACQQGRFHVEKLTEEQHAHQAVDDGRDAGKGLRRVFDDGHQAFASGVLAEVDGRSHAQGQHDDEGRNDHVNGVENVRQDADGAGEVAGLGAQQLPGQVGNALIEDVADEKQRQRAGDGHRKEHQDAHHAAVGLPPSGDRFVFHVQPSLLRLRKKFSVALMSIIKRYSTSAMENSACRCKPAPA